MTQQLLTQEKQKEKGIDEPQYVGCQHHVLDLILRHLLDFVFPTVSVGPNINYKFVNQITENYESLQNTYIAEANMPLSENPGWRDDIKFLFEMCEAYQFYKEFKKLPNIHWRKLPPLHAARWNSRATYVIIAYFLLPKLRRKLEKVCDFITGDWSLAWFCDQKFNENLYDKIVSSLTSLKCNKALNSFKTHWVNEVSVIDVPRSNKLAERSIKIMEDVFKTCKNDKYLNLKFVAKNRFDKS